MDSAQRSVHEGLMQPGEPYRSRKDGCLVDATRVAGGPWTYKDVLEWSLVLHSRGIPHILKTDGDGWSLQVDEIYKDRAIEEIRAFEAENDHWPLKAFGAHGREYELKAIEGTVFASIAVFSVFALFLSDSLRPILIEIGANDGERLLSGQWWRIITALTLHADPVHLLSNLFMGTIFLVLLSQLVGTPIAWTLALFTGAVGNLASAVLVQRHGASIGASTSIFGLLGSISGFCLIRASREKQSYRRPLFYLGAGLALLSFLGVGDANTDRTAHLMGFLIGLVSGGLLGPRPQKATEFAERYRLLIYTILTALVAASWAVALASS